MQAQRWWRDPAVIAERERPSVRALQEGGPSAGERQKGCMKKRYALCMRPGSVRTTSVMTSPGCTAVATTPLSAGRRRLSSAVKTTCHTSPSTSSQSPEDLESITQSPSAAGQAANGLCKARRERLFTARRKGSSEWPREGHLCQLAPVVGRQGGICSAHGKVWVPDIDAWRELMHF